MSALRIASIVSFVFGLAACSDPNGEANVQSVSVSPQEFALLPCAPRHHDACTLVVAGGKRILFGVPAGVTQTQNIEDLRQLDAVVVFSLAAQDLEGLDEVRNVSWRAGRSTPLMVIGPPGIEDVVTALNKALEQSDALYVVENGIPPGGYDAAVLTSRPARREMQVFNTGDLQITRTGFGYRITYRVNGSVTELALQSCGAVDELVLATPNVDQQVIVGCTGDAGDHAWPIADPIFIVEK